MSIKRRIIFILFFNLFIFVKLGNYISVQIIDVDDCIMNVKKNDNLIREVTPDYIRYGQLDKCYLDQFPFDNTLYKYGFLLEYYEYNFNDKLQFYFGDSDHTEGYMKMNVFFNEYKIQTKDRVFWKCWDCGYNYNGDYIIEPNERNYGFTAYNGRQLYGRVRDVENRMFFYNQPGSGSVDYLYVYYFTFIINNI